MHIEMDSLNQRSKGTWRMSCHPVFDDGTCGEREFHTIKAPRKREAKKIAGELRAKLEAELRAENPEGREASGYTLLSWQQAYADEMMAMGVIRLSTAISYVDAIRGCGEVALKDLAEITEQDMKDCLAHLMSDSRYCRNTAIKHFRAARSAIERACYEGLIQKNPARRIRTPRMESTKPRSLKSDERKRMAALLETVSDPISTAGKLGLFMGLRGEEVCGLRWSARDRGEQISYLTINEAAVMNAGKVALKEPKTESSKRRLPECSAVTEALDVRRRAQMEKCERYGVTFKESFFVLGDIDGEPLSPDKLRRDFRAVCDANGLDCTFHWLRHTFATRMIAQGVNARTVAQWLGHADPGFTLRVYCDADDGALVDSLGLVPTIIE